MVSMATFLPTQEGVVMERGVPTVYWVVKGASIGLFVLHLFPRLPSGRTGRHCSVADPTACPSRRRLCTRCSDPGAATLCAGAYAVLVAHIHPPSVICV